MVVDLFDDVAGSPGSSVLGFTQSVATPLTSSMSLLDFTPDTTFQLNAGTTYWLVATALTSVPITNQVALSTNSNPAAGTAAGNPGSFDFMCFGCAGPVWDSATTFATDQHGFLIQSAPEPMTAALLALGLAGVGCSRRRTRRT